jgi:hypothetical protein
MTKNTASEVISLSVAKWQQNNQKRIKAQQLRSANKILLGTKQHY